MRHEDVVGNLKRGLSHLLLVYDHVASGGQLHAAADLARLVPVGLSLVYRQVKKRKSQDGRCPVLSIASEVGTEEVLASILPLE